MKRYCILLAFAALFCGCRREDIRTVALEVPGLNATNETLVVEALSYYEGVDKPSIRFDQAAKTVTLKYDSMKVAQTNLRMAIEAKGIAVNFPANTTGMAGYINER